MKQTSKETKFEHGDIIFVHREGARTRPEVSLYCKRPGSDGEWGDTLEGILTLYEGLQLFLEQFGEIPSKRETLNARPEKQVEGPTPSAGKVILQLRDEDFVSLTETANNVLKLVEEERSKWPVLPALDEQASHLAFLVNRLILAVEPEAPPF
jgi:hypothetical protein